MTIIQCIYIVIIQYLFYMHVVCVCVYFVVIQWEYQECSTKVSTFHVIPIEKNHCIDTQNNIFDFIFFFQKSMIENDDSDTNKSK